MSRTSPKPLPTTEPVSWLGPLLSVLAIQATATFLTRIVPTLAPSFAARVEWPVESVGYLAALITTGSLLSQLLCMPLLRRAGAMRSLQIGLGFGVVGALLSVLPLPAALLAGCLVVGLCLGPPSLAGTQVLQRFAPPGHRSLMFSIKQAGVPLGSILAGLVLPLLAQNWSIEHAVVAAAAIALLTMAAVQPLRRRVDSGRDPMQAVGWRVFVTLDNLRRPLAMLVSMPALRRIGAAGACLGAGQSVWFAFLVTYLVAELHWTLPAAGALFALMQLVSVVGRPLLGYVADRLGSAVAVLQCAAVGSGLTTFALACSTPAWPTWSIVALAVAGGCSVSSWNGLQFAETARLAPADKLSETMTAANLLLLAAYVAGPALFGLTVAAGSGFGFAFGITALCTLSASLPLSRMKAN